MPSSGMGRVKLPRCDNCGAPVEFAEGVLEARCEYCGEVLMRELPPPPPAARHAPAPSAPVAPRATVWPFMVGGLATVAIAGASGIASLAANMKPLPSPAPVETAAVAIGREVRLEQGPAPTRPDLARDTPRDDTARRPRAADAGASRGRLLARPTASAAPSVAAPPPKPPPFNSEAAIAGLDAAKAKAEASCRGTSGVRLFVQMGFDADGANRGAALSDPKLKDTPEAKCTLRIFRAVRIPAFDLATRPSGLGRGVRL